MPSNKMGMAASSEAIADDDFGHSMPQQEIEESKQFIKNQKQQDYQKDLIKKSIE